jgi:hypothetical protein
VPRDLALGDDVETEGARIALLVEAHVPEFQGYPLLIALCPPLAGRLTVLKLPRRW